MKTIIRCAFAVIGLLSIPIPGYCQPAEHTVLEGHAFDKATLKPLANVAIVLTASDPATDLLLTVGMFTDANGFYSFSYPIPSHTVNVLRVDCLTRKGVASTQSKLYTGIRADIFRRDFYLTLPRNEKGCIGPN